MKSTTTFVRHLFFWLAIAGVIAILDYHVAPNGYGPRIHHQQVQMHKYGGTK